MASPHHEAQPLDDDRDSASQPVLRLEVDESSATPRGRHDSEVSGTTLAMASQPQHVDSDTETMDLEQQLVLDDLLLKAGKLDDIRTIAAGWLERIPDHRFTRELRGVIEHFVTDVTMAWTSLTAKLENNPMNIISRIESDTLDEFAERFYQLEDAAKGFIKAKRAKLDDEGQLQRGLLSDDEHEGPDDASASTSRTDDARAST